MTDTTWGPWIDHDGNGCPVPLGTVVKVEVMTLDGLRQGVEVITEKIKRDWDYIDRTTRECPRYHDLGVIRYRIKKPRGLVILESLIENLPATGYEHET